MHPVPSQLLAGPFTRARAIQLGVTAQMLRGHRFERVFHGVWKHRDHVMTFADQVEAARLALPDEAAVTGITRIQMAGLALGPRAPLRFVVARDLHLVLPDVFLHRTVRMPPRDDVGVTPLAAYVSYCSQARVIDAIKVGDWLLANGHMAVADLVAFCTEQGWRAGAKEALWVLPWLDPAARSPRESEVRAILVFAGMPAPESNVGAVTADDLSRIGDLVYRRWGVDIEYEGEHHQLDRGQYLKDIDRYASLRRAATPYIQVTKEKLARPRVMVAEVYHALCSRGYDGPQPRFGDHWRQLFMRLPDVVGLGAVREG